MSGVSCGIKDKSSFPTNYIKAKQGFTHEQNAAEAGRRLCLAAIKPYMKELDGNATLPHLFFKI